MITINEAAQAADTFIREVYGDVEETQLEEIETDDSRNYWFITLSFVTRDMTKNPTGPLASFTNPYQRKFKTLIVDATSGEVTKMKIWPLKAAQ